MSRYRVFGVLLVAFAAVFAVVFAPLTPLETAGVFMMIFAGIALSFVRF